MTTQKVLFEQSSDVGFQKDTLRSRVPTQILQHAGAEDRDSVNWQAIEEGNTKWIVGMVVKGGAKGRQAPVRTAAPKKAAAKKPGKAATRPTAAPSRPTRPTAAAGKATLEGAFDEPPTSVRPARAAGGVKRPVARPTVAATRPAPVRPRPAR